MKKMIVLLLLSIIYSSNTFGERTILSGNFNSHNKEVITLSFFKNSIDFVEGNTTFYESTINLNGDFKIEFNIDYPVSVNVMKGDKWLFYNKYICPGDSIQIDYLKETISIQGKGSGEMAFMFEYDAHMADYRKLQRPPQDLTPSEYLTSIKQKMNEKLKYFQEYFKDTVVSNDFRGIFECEVKYKCAIEYAQYSWRSDDVELEVFSEKVIRTFMKETEITINNPKALISTEYTHFLRELPYGVWRMNGKKDTTGYFSMNQQSLRDSISGIYFSDEVYDVALYTILFEDISWLSGHRGTERFDSLFAIEKAHLDSLGKSFSDKQFHSRLYDLLFNYKKTNEPALDFTAYDIDGKEVKLSDYKGKVVYVDFWATTCAPCVSELPSTKRLQEKFKDEEDIVFLYVSFDSSKEKVVDFIAKKEFAGIHLFNPKGFNSEASRKYKIRGIPRYILVGKDGMLISDDAPRPSNPNSETMIRNALLE
jgi:thiol-disulfide isomerase/thioredoxin